MRWTFKVVFFIWISSAMVSCVGSRTAIEYEILDGVYTSNIFNGTNEKVYVDNEPDELFVFPLKKYNGKYLIDTLNQNSLKFPQKRSYSALQSELFRVSGFDVDIITIPFKYRFPTAGVPQQLNTNLNASVFVGYRTDYYRLRYNLNEINEYERKTNHYGLTFGLFSGFGSSAISPFVTSDQVTIEYDGVVWSNGVAISLGIDYLNLGVALGFDQLLDSNSSVWIYNRKPFLGLVLGVNLN